MAADIRSELTALLRAALQSVAPESDGATIVLERPKQASHGDFASNLALQLAKPLKLNPRDIAGRLVAELPPSPLVAKVAVAGAGFINFTLAPAAKLRVVATVLAQGAAFGRGTLGGGIKVQVEFVSANPTGPLHVGHGRGAAYGASLASLLDFAGYRVTREFYVNDAGRQMDILGLSVWLRYLQADGADVPFPAQAYRGAYVEDIAHALRAECGGSLQLGAYRLASEMVCLYGMSARLGPLSFGRRESLFLGDGGFGRPQAASEATLEAIDAEIASLVREAHGTARRLLADRRQGLRQLASTLENEETLEGEKLEAALEAAKEPDEPIAEQPPGSVLVN